MVCRVLHLIFGRLCMHSLSQLTSNFNERRYYSWENSRWWGGRWWNSADNRLSSLFDSYISMHFLKDSMTPGRCFIIGCDSLEGQLVNSRVPEIVIYLRKYLHASFHHSSVFMRALCILHWSSMNRMYSCNIRTAVILNDREASRPLTHGRALKIRRCKKLFGGQKGVRANPLAYMPEYTKSLFKHPAFLFECFYGQKVS